MKTDKQQTPFQPIYTDEHGTYRFQKNKIVDFLLDNGGFDMNALAGMEFSREDRIQFAQLIGYSISGFGELPYVPGDRADIAQQIAERGGDTDRSVEIKYYRERFQRIREGLREPIAELYGRHPDDLLEVDDA